MNKKGAIALLQKCLLRAGTGGVHNFDPLAKSAYQPARCFPSQLRNPHGWGYKNTFLRAARRKKLFSTCSQSPKMPFFDKFAPTGGGWYNSSSKVLQ
jgi:hypothetical protein